MTRKTETSNSLFLLNTPTTDDVKRVFSLLEDSETLWYFPVVTTKKTSVVAIYIEEDPSGSYMGIGRVFTSVKDVEFYLKWLVYNGQSASELKAFQVKLPRAVESIRSLSEKQTKPIKFIVSTFYEYELINILTFWDGIPN